MAYPSKIQVMEKRAEGAQPGNQNALKFKTPEERQEVCRTLIEHLENAYDWESFGPCNKQTVWFYIENYPEDFPEYEIIAAHRAGKKKIEDLLMDLGTGENIKGNASAAIFLAKNKIGYTDKRELELTNNKKARPVDPTTDNLRAAQELRMKLIKGIVLEDETDDHDDE